MNNITFYTEVVIESKSQDLLQQIRDKLVNPPATAPILTSTQSLPRRRVLHNMENKNWEIVEKSDGTHCIRFMDELTYTEFMLLVD